MILNKIANTFRLFRTGRTLEHEIQLTKMKIHQLELKLVALNRRLEFNDLNSSQIKKNIHSTRQISAELMREKAKLERLERLR